MSLPNGALGAMTTDDRLSILADYVLKELSVREVAKLHGVEECKVGPILRQYGAMRTQRDRFIIRRRNELTA